MSSGVISSQLALAAGLIAATFLVHALIIVVSSPLLRAGKTHLSSQVVRDVGRLMGVALMLLLAHFVSIWMWACLYLYLDVFQTLETALYFAGSTYTTLGMGDILPAEEWRLLSSALATNGMLLFGLSAAILVDASVRLRQGGE